MTITGGSALSEEEINRMVKEAEEHATEDAKAKEETDTRNQAEQTAYSIERLIKDNKDKLTDATVTEVEEAIAKVRETLKGTGNVEDVKSALAELNEKSQKIGQEIYAQAQAAEQNGGANASGAAGGSGAAGSSDDNIVDAEVVDDEENK